MWMVAELYSGGPWMRAVAELSSDGPYTLMVSRKKWHLVKIERFNKIPEKNACLPKYSLTCHIHVEISNS